MSLKTPQSLLIIGAVVVALLAGTILVGGANILPIRSDTSLQADGAQATGQTSCPIAKARLAEAGDVKACPRKTAAEFDAKTCPLGRTEPCCAEEGEDCCCPKKAEGCCPKQSDGCCPAESKPCCPAEAKPCCP